MLLLHSQIAYAIKCIKYLAQNNMAAIEPKEAAQEAFIAKLQKILMERPSKAVRI